MSKYNLNIELLSEICEAPGAPGYEERIRNLILHEVEPLVDEVKIDNMGNLYAIKKGSKNPDGYRVMLAAHMDEISFMVNYIDENGFIRMNPLGGFDPKTLTAQRVIIHGKEDVIGVMGSKPIHIMTAEERGKPLKISDYFIDTGLPYEEVIKLVEIGNPITRERGLIKMGDCVNCKSIDNRVSVFIQIEMLRELTDVPYDVYAVFTVQEEVGIRGAQAATLQVEPDLAICIDTTIAFDVPGAKSHEKITELGKGTAIKIMDSRTICDHRMVSFMKEMANTHKVEWQTEILTRGGTDTSALQRMSAGGAIAGAVSIPTRHIHQSIEMAHQNDIRQTIDLLKACVSNINEYDWSFV